MSHQRHPEHLFGSLFRISPVQFHVSKNRATRPSLVWWCMTWTNLRSLTFTMTPVSSAASLIKPSVTASPFSKCPAGTVYSPSANPVLIRRPSKICSERRRIRCRSTQQAYLWGKGDSVRIIVGLGLLSTVAPRLQELTSEAGIQVLCQRIPSTKLGHLRSPERDNDRCKNSVRSVVQVHSNPPDFRSTIRPIRGCWPCGSCRWSWRIPTSTFRVWSHLCPYPQIVANDSRPSTRAHLLRTSRPRTPSESHWLGTGSTT